MKDLTLLFYFPSFLSVRCQYHHHHFILLTITIINLLVLPFPAPNARQHKASTPSEAPSRQTTNENTSPHFHPWRKYLLIACIAGLRRASRPSIPINNLFLPQGVRVAVLQKYPCARSFKFASTVLAIPIAPTN